MLDQTDLIEVNSELYFNEKFNLWLNKLTSSDVRLILDKCFHVSTDSIKANPFVCPWDEIDPFYGKSARFDQKIDFGKELCVIFELKVSTEATIGQLNKYLVYLTEAGFKQGYVFLLSRNEFSAQKLGYDQLITKHSNLFFVTWNQFESKLTQVFKDDLLESSKQATELFLYLLSFLTDIRKRSERLIIQPEPPPINLFQHMRTLRTAPLPKKRDSHLIWPSRESFWNDLIDFANKHSGQPSFCAFRFDFYEYMIRWAFHVKGVCMDIYEDKNYEYYYNYFIKFIYPNKNKVDNTTTAEIYYRFLLVREDELLSTRSHQIFFRRVGKIWYILRYQEEFYGFKSSLPSIQ